MAARVGVLAIPSSFVCRFSEDVLKVDGPALPKYLFWSEDNWWRHDLVVFNCRHCVRVLLAIVLLEFRLNRDRLFRNEPHCNVGVVLFHERRISRILRVLQSRLAFLPKRLEVSLSHFLDVQVFVESAHLLRIYIDRFLLLGVYIGLLYSKIAEAQEYHV